MLSPRDVQRDTPDPWAWTANETTTLSERLRDLGQDIIRQEMERLTRKAPSLTEPDLRVVTRILHEIVDELLVGRAAELPPPGA